MFWTPAFAGVTTQETFYETINPDDLVKSSISPPLAGGNEGEGDN